MTTAAGALLLVTLAALAGRRALALPALPTHQRQQQSTCGFSTCHGLKEGMVNVHLVPHSHDDVGWLKTMDEYYLGEKNNIQHANVSMILDSVFGQLIQDPNKRYIQVETAFLWLWWQHQNETTRNQYRELVQTGRVQITGGGWSMPDEATTNYQSIIDNFSWGFKFLNDTFGPCGVPNVGWQIDPFGHSRETASIMAAMGLQGTFVARLDYEDYELRKDTSNLETMWIASNNTGRRAHLFTSALYDHYGPPPNCCWDTLCDDEEISDSTDYIIESFISYVQEKARHFATNNIMLTMGNDFNYMDARKYYTNIDRLIGVINGRQQSGGNLNLVYSTPSCYLKAVNDARPTLSTKTDDFLPYASEVDGYWSGYFTSRPTVKFFERLGNNFLQVCKQLSALSGVARQDSSALDQLRRAMGVLQHHDAITGTEKKAVAQDYERMLTSAISSSEQLAQKALNILLAPATSNAAANTTSVEMKSCLLLNISQCDVSEQNENFIVTVYNPLSRAVSHYVRLPVMNGSYSVVDFDGATQATQTVPIPSPVLQLNDDLSDARQELVFRAADIPPLGLRSYRVSRTSSSSTATGNQPVSDSHIGNNYLRAEVSNETGLLTAIVVNGTTISMDQSMYYYDAFDGYNGESGMRSNGAYVFRPQQNVAREISSTATYSVFKGELVEEIHQVFNSWTSQVIRIYREEEYVEFEWLVRPVRSDSAGVQPISRFSTGLKSGGTFYTDSNGREMLTRRKNFRPTWNLTVSEPVAGNYYPVTSRILIKDDEQKLELAVLTDRSQGGSSLEDGQIELMLHRRLGVDDGMGVAESLDDSEPARGKHYVVVGQPPASGGITSAAKQRLLAQRKLLQPWLFLSPADNWPSNYKHQISGLNLALPENVQLLTLEPWGGNSVLLRLEHILEKNDDARLSQTATVDIENILAGFTVTSLRETTLDGNRWLSDVRRLAWNTTGYSSDSSEEQQEGEGSTISLSPMQIRTFIVDIAPRQQ